MWVDLCVGASAILIALISLAIALRQSQIMERQLAASVWPYLQYGTSNEDDQGQPVIHFDLENVGVGPARIHSISMRYQGRAIHNPAEFFAACCQDLIASAGQPGWAMSTAHHQVMAPNHPKEFLVLPDLARNHVFLPRLNAERQKVTIRICYCSVLDQCWMLDSDKDENEPIAACPLPQPDDYDG